MILHVLNWINMDQGFNHWYFNCVWVLKLLKTVPKTSVLHKNWKGLRVSGYLWSLCMAHFQKLAIGRALTHLEAMQQNTTFSQPYYDLMLPWWSGQVEKTDSDFRCWVRLTNLFIFLLNTSMLLLLCFCAFLQWDTGFIPMFILYTLTKGCLPCIVTSRTSVNDSLHYPSQNPADITVFLKRLHTFSESVPHTLRNLHQNPNTHTHNFEWQCVSWENKRLSSWKLCQMKRIVCTVSKKAIFYHCSLTVKQKLCLWF